MLTLSTEGFLESMYVGDYTLLIVESPTNCREFKPTILSIFVLLFIQFCIYCEGGFDLKNLE